MEATKEMLHGHDLPMHLSKEATRKTVYVQNHTPHRVLDNKTPEEASQERNHKLAILEYLAILCTFTFQK